MQERLSDAAIMGFRLVNRCPTGHQVYESIHVPAHLRFAPYVPGYEKISVLRTLLLGRVSMISVASISLRVGRDTKKSMSCGGRVCMMWCPLHFALCGLGYEVIAPCRCAIVVMSFECVVSPPPLLRIWRAFMDSGHNYSADICKYMKRYRTTEGQKIQKRVRRYNGLISGKLYFCCFCLFCSFVSLFRILGLPPSCWCYCCLYY